MLVTFRLARRLAIPLALVLAAATAPVAAAFQGPYSTFVTGYGGFQLDLDVRWPDGPPPAGGWPVVFWGHGAGGDKTSSANNAERYADDGYVTVAWTNRAVSTSPTPPIFAADLVAMKTWLVNDFQAEAGVTVPVDPGRFGITGSSLGGYTSWSAALKSNAFAVIVPFNWGIHFFANGITKNGSIERVTAGPLASLLATPYDDVDLQNAFDDVFDSSLGAFPGVTIPVMSDVALLDARTGGSYSLQDYLALPAATPRWFYFGTGGHGTPDTDDSYRGNQRDRWFAHYLQGVDNGIDSEPPINFALVGTNERLTFTSWPPPGQAITTAWLRDTGALASVPPPGSAPSATITNDPGSFTWDDAKPNFSPTLIRNNLPKSTVLWETAPLTDEVLLLGEPSVRLEVAGTGSRYQVNIHLYDLSDVDDPILLAYGTATPSTSPAVLDVAMSLTARRVPAGHRLRLEITNRDDEDVDYTDGFQAVGDVLRYIPFFELSTTDVFQDATRPSSLTLPLLGRDRLPLPGVACDPAPRTGCRLPTKTGSSPLTLKHRTPDTKDTLTWKWAKGSTTAFGDLGDPLDADGYTFCLYDGGSPSGALLFEASAPAGGLCGTKPCWKQVGSSTNPKGYKYSDKELTPDGIKTLRVLAGMAPKAKAIVKGKGENLGLPPLPLPLPVVAQLQAANACWEVTYGSATTNGPSVFKAK
jgi:predicted acyl esterase